MPSIYTPAQIRRLKELGAVDLGMSILPITGREPTRRKSAWNTDDDTDE